MTVQIGLSCSAWTDCTGTADMRFLGAMLDRLVLLAGVLAAACIPSFIVQYRQRLGGRLEQVQADIAPFQAIADHNFGGSLPRLIQYHLASRDSTFHQEGVALQGMLDAAAHLRDALQALNTDLLHQCLYLLRQPDVALLHSTWSAYQPGFTLTPQSGLFALALGLLVWLLFLGCWHGIALLTRAAVPTWQRSRGS
jgi:hypothetical protein